MMVFRATACEAASRLRKDAVRTALMPVLNQMDAIGMVSLPVMMMGEILGGSTVMEVDRYQMLIMYLIASTCFGSTIMILSLVMKVVFDSDHMMKTDQIFKRETKKTRKKTKKTMTMMITKIGGNSYGNGNGEADALMVGNDKDDDREARRYVPPSPPPLPFVSGGLVITTLRSGREERQNFSSLSDRSVASFPSTAARSARATIATRATRATRATTNTMKTTTTTTAATITTAAIVVVTIVPCASCSVTLAKPYLPERSCPYWVPRVAASPVCFGYWWAFVPTTTSVGVGVRVGAEQRRRRRRGRG